jgi:hypothetical protein
MIMNECLDVACLKILHVRKMKVSVGDIRMFQNTDLSFKYSILFGIPS